METPPFNPADPEAAIAAAAKRCSNWGRWGADDVLGTLNFLDEVKRLAGAACVRRGVSFSLAQSFTTFYEACPVLAASTPQLRASRLALCELTGRVLVQGMDLLGVTAPDQM